MNRFFSKMQPCQAEVLYDRTVREMANFIAKVKEMTFNIAIPSDEKEAESIVSTFLAS